jgi:hypothetical protein
MGSAFRTTAVASAVIAGLALSSHQATNAEAVRAPEKPIDSIREMFAALEACWEPPPMNESFPGMEMTIRFSFRRTGELMGPVRVTYSNSTAAADTRYAYGKSIEAAFRRCTPMPFTDGMAGAIAGRPLVVRFYDSRGQKKT